MEKKKNSSGFLLAGIDARFVKLGEPKRSLGLGVWGHLLSDHLHMPPLTHTRAVFGLGAGGIQQCLQNSSFLTNFPSSQLL